MHAPNNPILRYIHLLKMIFLYSCVKSQFEVVCVRIFVCMYVCIYVHVCMYVCIHVYTFDIICLLAHPLSLKYAYLFVLCCGERDCIVHVCVYVLWGKEDSRSPDNDKTP